MRRYWSVILLSARGVGGKLLALLAGLTAVEAALVGGLGLQWGILHLVLDSSHLLLVFRAALVILAAICCLWGSDVRGGRCRYTLGRLRMNEWTTAVLWGLCYTLAFLALMGFQLLLILAACWWAMEANGGAAGPQALFLASFQNSLFHGLLPLEDWGGYVRNVLYALSMGMCCSVWSFWNRRQGGGWVLYFVTALVVFTFPMGIGGTLDGFFLGGLAMIITAAGMFFVWQEVHHGED